MTFDRAADGSACSAGGLEIGGGGMVGSGVRDAVVKLAAQGSRNVGGMCHLGSSSARLRFREIMFARMCLAKSSVSGRC